MPDLDLDHLRAVAEAYRDHNEELVSGETWSVTTTKFAEAFTADVVLALLDRLQAEGNSPG